MAKVCKQGYICSHDMPYGHYEHKTSVNDDQYYKWTVWVVNKRELVMTTLFTSVQMSFNPNKKVLLL